jgi:hypothetical protein
MIEVRCGIVPKPSLCPLLPCIRAERRGKPSSLSLLPGIGVLGRVPSHALFLLPSLGTGGRCGATSPCPSPECVGARGHCARPAGVARRLHESAGAPTGQCISVSAVRPSLRTCGDGRAKPRAEPQGAHGCPASGDVWRELGMDVEQSCGAGLDEGVEGGFRIDSPPLRPEAREEGAEGGFLNDSAAHRQHRGLSCAARGPSEGTLPLLPATRGWTERRNQTREPFHCFRRRVREGRRPTPLPNSCFSRRRRGHYEHAGRER